MNLRKLRDVIIKTVWPYLGPAQGGQGAFPANRSLSQVPAAVPIPKQRMTEQVRFTTTPIGMAYVGRQDDIATLSQAALLYRARGNEVIKSFFLSRPSADTDAWTIELVVGLSSSRLTATSFSPPVYINFTGGLGSPQQEIFPNVALPANSFLFAKVTSGPAYNDGAGNRLDGVIEVERDATI